MSFWDGGVLAQKLPTLISPYTPDRIDCNAYTLSVGGEVYVTPTDADEDLKYRSVRMLQDAEAFSVPPGQFAFLITDEVITVPRDAMAFISIKAKIKFRGLVNVSGFHVDPGYNGRLVFSVYNAGPSPIHLRRGQECFLIWFAALTSTCPNAKQGIFNDRISTDLINAVPGELQSLEGVNQKIKDVEKKLLEKLSVVEAKQAAIDTKRAVLITICGALLVGLLLLAARVIYPYFKIWFFSP